jgi:hypothetical protein
MTSGAISAFVGYELSQGLISTGIAILSGVLGFLGSGGGMRLIVQEYLQRLKGIH